MHAATCPAAIAQTRSLPIQVQTGGAAAALGGTAALVQRQREPEAANAELAMLNGSDGHA